MRFFAYTAVLLAGTVTPVAAQQAFSKSMVECSVIYEEMTQIGTSATRTPERIAKARAWSDAFAKAAREQAQREGQPSPEAHVAELRQSLTKKWSGRFSSVLKLQENKDWLEYCRKFGRAQGILSQ